MNITAKPRRKRLTFPTFMLYFLLTLIGLICLLPIVNMIALSFSETSEAVAGHVYFWPKRFTTASYDLLVKEGEFFPAFMISCVRVVIGYVISMPVTILMAFALSHDKKAFKERNIVMWFCYFTQLFGGGLIPTYIIYSGYGLINTMWALVLPGAMNVYNMILMMNFFRGLPGELEEAAYIDGANAFQVLMRVYLPVSLPSIATISLFVVVSHWNAWFDGLIYLTERSMYPLQTYIRSLTVKIDFTSIQDPKQIEERLKVSSITFSSAKILVSMIPILCVYPFLQRYFVHGLTVGSVKG